VGYDQIKRDQRFRRRREEDSTPGSREERLKRNTPLTIERKRVWDQVDNDSGDTLGLSVDVERLKRQKLQEEQDELEQRVVSSDSSDEERDSMVDFASGDETEEIAQPRKSSQRRTATERATSPTQSMASTNLDFTPKALAAKFPTLFSTDTASTPKILITTGINGTVHKEAESLTNLFPHSVYIPRSSHRYSHRFSVREIASFASNRSYTAMLVLKEDLKRPTGLTVVHLPAGPTFHVSMTPLT
jgi:ribosome production factor 1